MQAQAQLPPATSRAPVAWLTLTHRAIAGVVVCAVAALAVFVLADSSSQPSLTRAPPSLPVATVASSTVLVLQPWIGSLCPGPHSPAAIRASFRVPLCGRVGLEIDLRRPALSATATINGQTFKLDDRWWSYPPFSTGKHTVLAGFLHHARFLYGPFKTVTFRSAIRQRFTIENVHLVIDYGAGHKVQTSVQELGYGGWG